MESRKQLTAQEYKELVEGHGFRIEKQEVDPVKVPLQGGWTYHHSPISSKAPWPGVPLDKASMALKKAARETFEEMKISYTTRKLARHSRRSRLRTAACQGAVEL